MFVTVSRCSKAVASSRKGRLKKSPPIPACRPRTWERPTMLRVEKLHATYGRLEALHGLDLFVPPGKIVALLGSNGAGKSTTLGAVAGMVRVTSGSVDLDGKRITGLRTHQIVQSGVVLVPQERELFGDLSVAENLEMGAISVHDQQVRKEQLETMLTKFPRLRERYRQRAATLSGGE